MAFVFPKWRAHNVADWEDLLVSTGDGRKELNPITILLLNVMPSIGIIELTEENAFDFWTRMTLIENLHGGFFQAPGEHGQRYFITKDDIIRHIGLETEGSKKTHAEFYDEIRRRVTFGQIDSTRTAAFLANGRRSLLDVVQGRLTGASS